MMEQEMTPKQAIQLLREKARDTDRIIELRHDDPEVTKWGLTTVDILDAAFGKPNDYTQRFTSHAALSHGPAAPDSEHQELHQDQRSQQKAVLESIIELLETLPPHTAVSTTEATAPSKPAESKKRVWLQVTGVVAVPIVVALIALIPHWFPGGLGANKEKTRHPLEIEAAKLAERLRASKAGPFAAMEDGIDIVAKARKLANDYVDANRKEAFLATFTGMTREELAEELMTALSDHQSARRLVGSFAQAAAEGVEAILRQAAIQGMEVPPDSKIETVLATVKKRLEQVTTVQANIGKAMSSMKGKDNKSNEAAIQTAVTGVTSAKEFINSVRTDPLVQESSRLLLQAGQDLAASETERLQEMRRHLEAMQAIQEGLTRRDLLYPGELFLPALILVGTDDEFIEAARDLGEEFLASPTVLDWKKCRQKNWADAASFAQFVEKSFEAAENPTRVSESCPPEIQQRFGIHAGMFIASLGVILFDEHTFDAQQAVAAAAELHLHSVRLSRINSRQRIDLVGQVTEALRIYYQGGVTPQQAAQMVLMAANVLATGATSRPSSSEC